MDATAVNDCKTVYAEFMTLELSQLMAEIPGVKLDQAKFDACLADFGTLLGTCPDSYEFSSVASCAGPAGSGPSFITGMQTEGEKCAASASCAGGLGCDKVQATCQPRKAVGESCATVECQAGLYCNSVHQCAQQGVANTACDHTLTGAKPCQPGLICVNTNTCLAPHALTEDCTDVAGAYCSTTCLAQKAGGEACNNDEECLSDACDSHQCDPASFCSAGIFGN